MIALTGENCFARFIAVAFFKLRFHGSTKSLLQKQKTYFFYQSIK